MVVLVFTGLLVSSVKITQVRHYVDYYFSVQFDHGPKDSVRAGMMRAEVKLEYLVWRK
jgi:hypothetical protein